MPPRCLIFSICWISCLLLPSAAPLAIPHGTGGAGVVTHGTHGRSQPEEGALEPGKHSSPLRLLPGAPSQEQPETDAPLRAEQQGFRPQHKRKAPLFMVDLFNTVQRASGGRSPLRGSLRVPRTPRSQKDILQGNIVRSLQDKGPGRFHFFNLSSVGRDEKVIKAEFRWFRTKQRARSPLEAKRRHYYKVDLYEVGVGLASPWKPGKLISSKLLPLHSQGWEVIDVTPTVSTWLQNNEENRGFLLVSSLHSDTQPQGEPQSSLHSDNQPQGEPQSSLHSDTQPQGEPEVQHRNAYLVLFSDDAPTADPGAPVDPAAGAADPVLSPSPSRKRRSFPQPRPQPCRRVPLFVDFEEIGWGGWIISPRGYNAYSCAGACPFPLGESLRATNHATVRSIMHALRLTPRGDEGAPCCVPDKLQAISLLYFDEDENVVLKQYDGMVALSCGCQ